MKPFDPVEECFEATSDIVAAYEFARDYNGVKRAVAKVHPRTALLALVHQAFEERWSKRFVLEQVDRIWADMAEHHDMDA